MTLEYYKSLKQMNDVEMAEGGLNPGQRALREERPDIVAKMEGVSEKEVMGMAEGGAARAFRYNDNGGKGTF